jgi:hypothetical protein
MAPDDKTICERLKALEVESILRWSAHAQQAAERHGEIKEKLAAIAAILTNLPCAVRLSWYKSIEGRINWLWSLVLLILAGSLGLVFWVNATVSAPIRAVRAEIQSVEKGVKSIKIADELKRGFQ